MWDPVSKKCGCQWIPGLEPGAPTDPCSDIVCIAEMIPTVGADGVCGCVYIPGLEPGASTVSKTTTTKKVNGV